jgi:hypothetical protein
MIDAKGFALKANLSACIFAFFVYIFLLYSIHNQGFPPFSVGVSIFKGGFEMVIVGRHINDITLNPLEYLLDDGEVREFISEDAAKEFLKGKGFTDDDFGSLAFETV